MKKLIASAVVAAAVALPAIPASATETDAWWGRKPCPWGYAGTIVWHDTPVTEYDEVRLCFPIYPDGTTGTDLPGGRGVATTADGAARAGVRNCQDRHAGYRGVYVWWYDLDNRYHETKTCIYVGP